MRAAPEEQHVVLDKVREYERLLPILGSIVGTVFEDEGRFAEINEFYQGIRRDRDGRNERSFDITCIEASRLAGAIQSTRVYDKLFEIHANREGLDPRQREREYMSALMMRAGYATELNQIMSDIYAPSVIEPHEHASTFVEL